MKIKEVRKIATDFVKRSLQKEGALVRAGRTHEGWEVVFDVIEPSAYRRALGIPAAVQDRLLYVIMLDEGLKVWAWLRLASGVEPAYTASRTA